MSSRYARMRAIFAIAKASLLSIFRSPTAVVFSLLFPIIFIVVFGAMVDTAAVSVKVGVPEDCDTTNVIYKAITSVKIIKPKMNMSANEMRDALQKGQLAAILNIKESLLPNSAPHYNIELITSNSSVDKLPLLRSVIGEAVNGLNEKLFPKNPSAASIVVTKISGRVYRSIDFILPGQLGFSLLMAGVFGSAFLLFNLRQGFVLKRLYAAPVRRSNIILGELLSRLFFQVIGFMIMIALGYFAFHFTLINGVFTFLEMLLFSVLGLIIFLGMGFIISGVTDTESSIAPIANTVTLPQILLCGLFFPVENYPHWLLSFCKLLPLTFFVDGLRKIAFEGQHIWQMPTQVIGLIAWTIVIGVITIKAFRWE
jgi:ABC-2 type transport system permease protein